MKLKLKALALIVGLTLCAGASAQGTGDELESFGELTVYTAVVVDNSEEVAPDEFEIHVFTQTDEIAGSPQEGSSYGVSYFLPAGTYIVQGENASARGFAAPTFSGDCTIAGIIELRVDEQKSCTVTYHEVSSDEMEPTGDTGSDTTSNASSSESSSSDLSVSCNVSPTTARTGETVTYQTRVSGGGSSYTYEWKGPESLSGNSSSVTKSYVTAGTKRSNVTVTSGADSKTASCTVTILPPQNCQSCGGSFDQPVVVVREEKQTSTTTPIAVSLSAETPETGLYDDFTVPAFAAVLAIFSATWILLLQKRRIIMASMFDNARFSGNALGRDTKENRRAQLQERLSKHAISSEPRVMRLGRHEKPLLDVLEVEGYQANAVISGMGLNLIAEMAENDAATACKLLRRLIAASASPLYRDGDGWLLLNRNAILNLLRSQHPRKI